METSKLFKGRKDEEITTMKANIWFLRFLHKFGNRNESYQDIAIRLITAKKLDSEDSAKLKQEIKNYEKFL